MLSFLLFNLDFCFIYVSFKTNLFYQLLQLFLSRQILATQIHVDQTVNAGPRAPGRCAPASRDISEVRQTVDQSVS